MLKLNYLIKLEKQILKMQNLKSDVDKLDIDKFKKVQVIEAI